MPQGQLRESDADTVAGVAPRARERSRFLRAALLGSLVALAIDLAMLVGPDFTLVRDKGMLGSFYDVQGRALLDGHLDVDPAEVGFEGFRVDGRTYTYFGLVPALLRLPVLAATDQLDGRLTQLSMLLALCVLLAAGAQLHWRIRCEMRPAAPCERGEGVAAFLLQVALGAGAIPLYLASRPVVYHEAELWGGALAVATIAAAVAVVEAPTTRRIAWAGALAALAMSTRFSVGLGPVIALSLIAAGLAARLRGERRRSRLLGMVASFGPRGPYRAGRRTVALLVVAALAPVALHAVVNIAKFDTPFGIPIEKQVASRIEPNRRAALDANEGKLFGLKFVPTALLQAVRPDAVGGLRAFPFVSLPAQPAKVVGAVQFDTVQPSLSAPTSMPAFVALSLLGIVALVRRRRLRPLLGILAATICGFAVTLTIAFVTTRYLADFVPFLLVGGLAGVQALLDVRRGRNVMLGALAVLVLLGVVINGSAGLVSQRLFYPEISPAERAAFVRTQDEVDGFLSRRPTGVRAGPELPGRPSGSPGDLFVLDRCAGLYVQGLDSEWLPVERTERSGLHNLRVRFPARASRRSEALLTLGRGPRRIVLTSRGEGAATVLGLDVGRRTAASARALQLPSTRPVDVTLSIDPLYGNYAFGVWYATVRVAGRNVLDARVPYDRRARVTVGADPGGLAAFTGRAERAGTPPTACRAVVGR